MKQGYLLLLMFVMGAALFAVLPSASTDKICAGLHL
jgi:hypothetical protein